MNKDFYSNEFLLQDVVEDSFLIDVFKFSMVHSHYNIHYNDEHIFEMCGMDFNECLNHRRIIYLFHEAKIEYLGEKNE